MLLHAIDTLQIKPTRTQLTARGSFTPPTHARFQKISAPQERSTRTHSKVLLHAMPGAMKLTTDSHMHTSNLRCRVRCQWARNEMSLRVISSEEGAASPRARDHSSQELQIEPVIPANLQEPEQMSQGVYEESCKSTSEQNVCCV